MRLARASFPFLSWTRPAFSFLDPGPLVDNELELVVPSADRVDSVLAACHPGSSHDIIRRQLIEFIAAFPDGRQPPDRLGEVLPTYHFWMRIPDPEKPIAGGITLRIGNTHDAVNYYGHIGYHVHPHARGRHYAMRACRLLLPLALRHGLNPLWITCNPDNFASRRTCELLGATLVETIPVPPHHALHARGDFEKCRYRLDLGGT